MRRRRYLINKYEGVIKKYRLRYSTNITKYVNESRVPVLELVWLIWKVSQSESYLKRVPCIASNVENFHENFSIAPSAINKVYNMYKSPDLAILREAIFLSIMLTHKNVVTTETGKKIHAIFKKHPENNLRVAVEHLRRSGAVAAKEKLFNNQMHRLHLEDIATSAYKISAYYLRRWLGRLNSEFATSLSKLLDKELRITKIKGSAEINCVMCELQALGWLEIKTATRPVIVEPVGFSSDQMNVIDIETKHKLKSGTVAWERTPLTRDLSAVTVAAMCEDLDYESILNDIQKSAIIFLDENQEYDMSDIIVRHLDGKSENGSSFKELQAITGYSSKDLDQRLHQLETQNIVKRVGLQENVIVLLKYIHKWALQVDNKYVIVTPWLTIDFEIRIEILLEWTGVILNKVFEFPGSSLTFLSESFELITCRALQDACMFLAHTKCVTLQIAKCNTPDLFSDTDEEPEITEFSKYDSTENILVYPVVNSVSRYVYLRKNCWKYGRKTKW